MGVLDGKVAIVTGSGRGLGRCHALAMAKEGAKLVINDVGSEWDGTGQTKGPAEDVVKEIKAMGGKAVACYDSVADHNASKNIIDTAVKTFGRLDILVNNAGFLRDKMLVSMEEDMFDAVITVHLKGTFNCTKWAAVYWREQSKAGKPINGRVISTTSHAALAGNVGQTNYGAAKAGIINMTMTWADELARFNCTANAIAPMARTRMTMTGPAAVYFGEKPAEGQFDQFAPENISPLVVYLASDAAQGINGRVMSIRGSIFEVFKPMSVQKAIDLKKQWTLADIQKKIKEFGDLGKPGIESPL